MEGEGMKLTIPMKLPSLANCRMHWRAMDRLKKYQKQAVTLYVRDPLPELPATVTLTRVGPRTLDQDNLVSAFKYIVDQLARLYGVDDGSDKYSWVYKQRVEKQYAIEIEICHALTQATPSSASRSRRSRGAGTTAATSAGSGDCTT